MFFPYNAQSIYPSPNTPPHLKATSSQAGKPLTNIPQPATASSLQQSNNTSTNNNNNLSTGGSTTCCQSSRQPSYRKCMWTEEEDKVLKEAVKSQGTKNWSLVSSLVPGRNGKQCRERWSGMLDPELAKEAWTPEEDSLLVKLHNEYGNKWAKISSYLPGRSRISLRNRWSYHVRHNFQKVNINSSPNSSPMPPPLPPPLCIPPPQSFPLQSHQQQQQQHRQYYGQMLNGNVTITADNNGKYGYSSTSCSSEENEYSESDESTSTSPSSKTSSCSSCSSCSSSGSQQQDEESGNSCASLFNFIVFEGKSWEELDQLTNCVEADMLFEPTW